MTMFRFPLWGEGGGKREPLEKGFLDNYQKRGFPPPPPPPPSSLYIRVCVRVRVLIRKTLTFYLWKIRGEEERCVVSSPFDATSKASLSLSLSSFRLFVCSPNYSLFKKKGGELTEANSISLVFSLSLSRLIYRSVVSFTFEVFSNKVSLSLFFYERIFKIVKANFREIFWGERYIEREGVSRWSIHPSILRINRKLGGWVAIVALSFRPLAVISSILLGKPVCFS